jgi:thymidylate synthase
MNNLLDRQYQSLLFDIIENGIKKQDRTGTGTRSVFGRQIRHKMSEGFPLLTTKKMPFRLIVTELIWFLRGDTNIKFLVDNGCHIWDGDAYKNYYNKTKDLTFDDFEVKGNGVITITGFDMESIDVYGTVSGSISNGYFRPFTQEEFINKIKTDNVFAEKWGDLGPIYGKQWRNWGGYKRVPSGWNHGSVTDYNDVPNNDQITNLINDLKTNPDSRRLMVNAWNVGELDLMVLPPCHYGFQVYTRELSLNDRILEYAKRGLDPYEFMKYKSGLIIPESKTLEVLNKYNIPTRAISLMWNQRSVDTFLGLPFNIASYGLLLEIIAKTVNMVPDELIGNLGDTHLYENHLTQAGQQIIREPYQLPKLVHMKTDEFYKSLSKDISLFTHLENTDFVVENYQSHPTIKAPLSN